MSSDKVCFVCGSEEQSSYFSFPKNKLESDSWKENLNIPKTCDTSKALVCSDHFIIKKGQRYGLKPQNEENTSQLKNEKNPDKRHTICTVCGVNKGENLSYHHFPKSLELRKEWIIACDLPSEFVTNSSTLRLCSRHFKPEDYTNLFNKTRSRLKPDAVPSVFHELSVMEEEDVSHIILPATTLSLPTPMLTMPPSQLSPTPICSSPSIMEKESNSHIILPATMPQLSTPVPTMPLSRSSPTPIRCSPATTPVCSLRQSNSKPKRFINFRYPEDIRTPHYLSPRLARKGVGFLKSELMKYKNQTVLLKRKLDRALNKISNVNHVIQELTSNNRISNDLNQHLMDILPPTMRKIGLRMLAGNTATYEPEIRKFALTLHFYSSNAYNFVRQQWNNLLPHPSTLRKWFCTSQCNPGFSQEVLSFLKNKAETQTKPIICNLVVDEMSIRQQFLYKNNELYGPVNLGFKRERTEEELDDLLSADKVNKNTGAPVLAKSALVLMLVALNDCWKVPCGYFFIASLNGNERSQLLKRCLELLHEHKVTVRSLTFDGTAVNFSMVEKLGASFKLNDTFKPSFGHPVTKLTIFIFPDPPHMMKNTRNVVGKTVKVKSDGTREESPLYDADGQIISWQFIQKLFQKQTEEGLRAANKLTIRHIRYTDSIMNVRLAVQTLSHSVAASLQYLQLHGEDEKFKDAGGTANFCEIFNDAFDILNCRSQTAHNNEYGRPINERNLPKLKNRAEEIIKYIKSLKTSNGTPITASKQRCGFIGIITCLTNVLKLYEELKEYDMTYLLSYKLCQDHLENFFSWVRMRGGFNNNPNTWQFRVAYRRLIVHHQLKCSNAANCSPDETPILFVSSKTFVEEEFDFEPLETAREKFDFDNLEIMSEFVKDVVDYIGGFIVRKVQKHPCIQQCECCKHAIEDKNRRSSLIDAKSKGFLKTPSSDLFKFLLRLEEIIRLNKFSIWSPDFIPTTLHTISAEFPDIFQGNHSPTHRDTLKKFAGALYFKIRLHYESTILNEAEKYIRRTFTNIIQWKGQ